MLQYAEIADLRNEVRACQTRAEHWVADADNFWPAIRDFWLSKKRELEQRIVILLCE